MTSLLRGCYNRSIIMPFVFLLFFSFFLETPAVVAEFSGDADFMIDLAGYGEAKLSTVVVSGTLLCDSCSNGEAKLQHHPVSGASVAVSCHPGRKTRKSNWIRGTTDEYGDFLLDLSSHLHGIPNLEKICQVKVIQLPRSSRCRHGFTGQHKGIELTSIGDGIRTYTTGTIRMRPKVAHACRKILPKERRMDKSAY